MKHKRYPLAYLLEVVMPLNLVITRDEETGEIERANQAISDWVMTFEGGNGKSVTVTYFNRHKKPFEFQCKGFDNHPYYMCNEQRMFAVKTADLWDAIQILHALDALANARQMQLV